MTNELVRLIYKPYKMAFVFSGAEMLFIGNYWDIPYRYLGKMKVKHLTHEEYIELGGKE